MDFLEVLNIRGFDLNLKTLVKCNSEVSGRPTKKPFPKIFLIEMKSEKFWQHGPYKRSFNAFGIPKIKISGGDFFEKLEKRRVGRAVLKISYII